MSTKNIPPITLLQTAPTENHYWCTFTDQTESEIASLCSAMMPEPSGAVLLPETDPRVQCFINPPEGQTVQRLTLETMEDLHRLALQFEEGVPRPLYRGQSNYMWPLETRLERKIPEFVRSETGLEVYEYQMLIESQRRLHHFFEELPDENDRLSWLALLRHHSVPTRLLDVTRSLFVACYFALRDMKPETDAAIWIFSRHHIDKAFSAWGRQADASWIRVSPFTVAQYGEPYYWPHPKMKTANLATPTLETIRHSDLPFALDFSATLDAALRGFIERPGIAIAEPSWLTRRLDVQQGAFLIPFNIRVPFHNNLLSFLQIRPEESDERTVPTEPDELLRLWMNAKVIKLRIPTSLQSQLRKRLETMNIRELTLFPDAEGALAHITSLIPTDGR